MLDTTRLGSGRLMLINPDRVFYAGLLGRPRRRITGGFAIYAAIHGELHLEVEGDAPQSGELVIVPPYRPHRIASEAASIYCIILEAESVEGAALSDLLLDRGDARERQLARIRDAYRELSAAGGSDGFTTAEFDALFFGRSLPTRPLDSRIARAITLLHDVTARPMTAADCAGAVKLSQSRFLHLFKDDTGVSFRAFRAWKRARHLLHFVNEDVNLAHLAQDIGYPDSTHFSHSIRRYYGLQPRAIFLGSRDLAIWRGFGRDGTAPLLHQDRG